MSSRVAELAKCANGCGYRQCRRFRGLRICGRCWSKRVATCALKEHQAQVVREAQWEEKKNR